MEPNESIPFLRAFDAAANRAREALRVLEDFVRFGLDDRHLTSRLKDLRHRLTATLGEIPMADRLAARETAADVGTSLSTSAEEVRRDAADLLTANFLRLQEALRSLEEMGKTPQQPFGAAVKQLRYEAYTLQRAVCITQSSLERLAQARLYVLIDGQDSPAVFEALASSLVSAGVALLQLRDKRLNDRLLLDRARTLRRLTKGTSTLFIMNDRPDLALLSRADGVHVGQEELTVKDARSVVGPHALIGVSTHSIEQARQAVLDGADYIGVGPTFPSGTKQFAHFAGLALVEQVAAEIRLPAFAIGGIGEENVAAVVAAGLSRIAVGGAVIASPQPATAARVLRARLTT
jgi:thiamine-phosphate pyrophosphorylase